MGRKWGRLHNFYFGYCFVIFLLELFRDVQIDLTSYITAFVSQTSGYDINADSLFEHKGCVRMSQGMGSDWPSNNLFGVFPQILAIRKIFNVFAILISQKQFRFWIPALHPLVEHEGS